MFVKPRNGLLVPDLRGGFLPEAGAVVVPSQHWARLARAGDLTVQRHPAPQRGSEKKTGKTRKA
jgi:hypothetical protein